MVYQSQAETGLAAVHLHLTAFFFDGSRHRVFADGVTCFECCIEHTGWLDYKEYRHIRMVGILYQQCDNSSYCHVAVRSHF